MKTARKRYVETGYVTLGKLRRKEDCNKGCCRCCGWLVERKELKQQKKGRRGE